MWLTGGKHPCCCLLTGGKHPSCCLLTGGKHPCCCLLTGGKTPSCCLYSWVVDGLKAVKFRTFIGRFFFFSSDIVTVKRFSSLIKVETVSSKL